MRSPAVAMSSRWISLTPPPKVITRLRLDWMSNQHIGLSEGLRGYGDNLFPYHYYTVGQSLASIVISTGFGSPVDSGFACSSLADWSCRSN